jgi:hypothetical protein
VRNPVIPDHFHVFHSPNLCGGSAQKIAKTTTIMPSNVFGEIQIWGLIFLVWAIFFLPETKGRTLEDCIPLLLIKANGQVDEMFAQKLSAWKFKNYECVGIEHAQETKDS